MTGRPKILVTQKVPDPAYPLLEEIGEVDEDDEDWGEYQLDRNQYERDGEGIKYHSCTKTGYVPELAEEDGFIKKDVFQAARFKSYN